MNDLRIIDADGHVQERDADWQELLDPPYRKHAPKMVTGPEGKEQLLLEGKIWAKPSGVGLGIGTAPYSRRPQKRPGCSTRSSDCKIWILKASRPRLISARRFF